MSQNSAPVINPSDLAAIIARDHGRGFAASPPHRGTALASSEGFLPSNFATEAIRIVPDPATDLPSDADPGSIVLGFPDPHPAQPVAPERDVDAELAAAFAKGKEAGLAEGLAIGRAEAEALRQDAALGDLSAARAMFLRATEFVTATQEAMSREIATSVEAAVLRLVAQRAGQVITENPAPFITRVERIADRVTQGLRAVQISLHPDDLAIMEDHLLGYLPSGSLLRPDLALMRGDVIVRAPSISVSDLLEGMQP